ncbi:MAG: hypothetical protein HOP02_07195 [Methylococcaceae bacterium]|nr:hypothetical protein [Methylococcaceae bacterium]
MKIIPACCMIIPMLMPISSQADNGQPDESVISIRPKAFFKDTTIWTLPSNNTLSVCWVNLNQTTQSQRNLAASAVTNSWSANSLVKFGGWDTTCPPESTFFNGVRISINSTDKSSPITWGLGTEVRTRHSPITGYPNGGLGLWLDFQLTTKSNGFDSVTVAKSNLERCATNNKTKDQCIAFTVAHEFGHVLGLSHEHNRSDEPLFPGLCGINNSAEENVMGNTDFTDFDPNSIMNYCRQRYFGDSSLSRMDMVAIKAYYGRIPTFNFDTGVLDIPRIMSGGVPWKATLRKFNTDTLGIVDLTQTNNLPENQSSALSSVTGSTVSLPLLRVTTGGKVVQLYQAVLRWNPDNSFTIVTSTVHPDARPSAIGLRQLPVATAPSAAKLPVPTQVQPFF